MFRNWSWLALASLSVGCGADETLSAPAPPEPTATEVTYDTEATPDSGLLDICGALWGFFGAPGLAERVCALRTPDPMDAAAVGQCKLCATTLDFVNQVLPAPECKGTVPNCPVDDASLRECFQTIGAAVTALLPTCSPDPTSSAPDTAQLGLIIATSSCGPVLTVCEPLQRLVVGLVGATL